MAILSFYSIGQYTIWAYIGEAMKWKEDGIEWVPDGKRVQIWLTRVGSGLLLLPALIFDFDTESDASARNGSCALDNGQSPAPI